VTEQRVIAADPDSGSFEIADDESLRNVRSGARALVSGRRPNTTNETPESEPCGDR